jgi:hypothetical protein
MRPKELVWRLHDGMALAVAGGAGGTVARQVPREHSMATGPRELPGMPRGVEPTAAVAGSIPAAPAG